MPTPSHLPVAEAAHGDTTHAYPLSDDVLAELVDRGVRRRFPARAVLVTEEDRGDTLFVILSGSVKAYGTTAEGREVVYSVLGPGELFGELSLDGGSRSASIMTLQPTICAVVTGAQARYLVRERAEFAQYLIMRLIRTVRRITDTVKTLALGDASERLTHLLTSLARADASGRIAVEGLTQQDIAERIGCSREMVSRIMKQLAAAGHVRVERRRIVLLRGLRTDD